MELGDKDVQDHEVDHDWTARFFNDVQDVSSEEMQHLWARILVGEVERPGSTSTRTLSVLKDMNKRVAQIFSWFCTLCIYSEWNRHGNGDDGRVCNACFDRITTRGFRRSYLDLLNEHGLVNSDFDSWHDMQPAVGFGRIQPNQPIPFSLSGPVLGAISHWWPPGYRDRFSGLAAPRCGANQIGHGVVQSGASGTPRRLQGGPSQLFCGGGATNDSC